MNSELLTIEQLAQLLHLHVMTVYRLAKQGKLPGFKVGGRWRFQREAIQEWMTDRMESVRRQAEDQNGDEGNHSPSR